MEYKGKTGEVFEVHTVSSEDYSKITARENDRLVLLWFEKDNNKLIIDAVEQTFHKNEIIFLTSFHQIKVISINSAKVLQFNKPFFCVINHDSEVGCKGILFYGATKLPAICVKNQELETLEAVWKMLCLEMKSADELQLEMLQMMLKRILIICTRIYKEQRKYTTFEPAQSETIREFNFLVEQHFRTKHTVAQYADLLFKSPKTLSNLFKKLNSKTPLELIQDRIILESKRQLSYTKKGISDIAFEVGYDDVQSFSRFFKKKVNLSPTEFRQQQTSL